jgi:hypothetical protein
VSTEPLRAELDGDHLVLTLTPKAVRLLRTATELLVDHIGDKWSDRWSRRRRAIRARLFPPAYRQPEMQEDYLRRHGAAAKADLLAAARRVLAALAGDQPVRCPVDESDDWIRVLGVTRLLYTPRDTPLVDGTTAGYLAWAQHHVLITLRPALDRVWER